MGMQVGTLLLDDGEQQVTHLEPRRAPVAILPLVHPPVGERKRRTRGTRLVRDQRHAVGTADGACVVSLAERSFGYAATVVRADRRQERAELVAAEAVGRAAVTDGR